MALSPIPLRRRVEEPDYSRLDADQLEQLVWRGDRNPGYIRNGQDDLLGQPSLGYSLTSVVLHPVPRVMMQTPERVWVRPRCPSKRIDGRRGTRKAWKRANPPHWVPTGLMRDVVMVNGRDMYLSKELADDLKRATKQRFLVDSRIEPYQDHVRVKLKWQCQRVVERFQETIGGSRVGHIDAETFTEEEEVFARDYETAERMIEEASHFS